MRRPGIPEFVLDVTRDPGRRGVLIAGSLTLVAVGLVPRALAPGLPQNQVALRGLQPEVESLYLLLAFASAAAIILGGLVSDLVRRRGLLIAALVAMMAGAVVNVVIDSGPLYYAATFIAVVASGVALAYGIGSVAVAYEGVARATALGIVYASYGAASATAPALMTMLSDVQPSDDPSQTATFSYETWIAYLAAAGAAAVAIWAAHRWMPKLPGQLPAPRGLITGVAVWSISILAIVTGVVSLPGAVALIPVALVVLGALGLSTSAFHFRRTAELMASLRLEKRFLGAALAVGVAVGFAQAIPLMLLPIVFQYPLGYRPPILATVAIAPFVLALLLAGPVSGYLLGRYGPRGLMTFGTLFLGLANLALALLLDVVGRSASYLAFVVPLVLIGAGFVVATTVRTAIVFASTPRGLPASAAAINEASVSLGSRIGIVSATTIVAAVAMDSARSIFQGNPDAESLVSTFEEALVALGTPIFGQLTKGANLDQVAAYSTAYLDGVGAALAVSGVVGIAGAVLAWVLTGRRDPLHTVFDMQDERDDAPLRVEL